MTDIPSMPLYPDAYMADTQHLTLEEHGAYTRLLMIHWRLLPAHIPDDEKRVARMLGVTAGKWRKLRVIICDEKLYSVRDGFLRQKRLEKEFDYAAKNRKKKRNAANARWGDNVLENNKTGDADAYADNDAQDHAADDAETMHMDKPPTPTPLSKNKQQHPIPSSDRDDDVVSEEPVGVIKAFDDAIASAWGDNRRRPFPNPLDGMTARKFLDAGASVARCGEIFRAVMTGMAAKGQEPPGTLKYFEGIVPQHLGEAAKPLPDSPKTEGGQPSLTGTQQAELSAYVRAFMADGKTPEEASRLALAKINEPLLEIPESQRRQA